jgi:hypothetical protein
MIGIYSKGFVADVDRFNDVWNQPIVGYESSFFEEQPLIATDFRDGIERKVRVITIMKYGDELEFYTPEAAAEGVLSFVSKNPVSGTLAQLTSARKYEYILDLNSQGEIVGGSWISEARPDMLWMMTKNKKFRDGRFPLEGLNQIYKPVKR